MISFRSAQFPKHVILHAVFFYVRYAVSYRDLEEILSERGDRVDHATLNRWIIKYASALASSPQRRKATTQPSWRLDETYVKVGGEWCYLCRAVDRNGQTHDFVLSEHRDETAGLRFLAKAVLSNGMPRAYAIDKSGANTPGLKKLNAVL